MKKFTFLFLLLVLPVFAFCQSQADTEKEKAAIKTVIEKETNSWINLDYEGWRDCYTQNEPFARLNSTPDYWGGANNWALYDSSMHAYYINYEGPSPQPLKYNNEEYLIRVIDDAAWVVYFENYFDNEGSKTGRNFCTRFLEKQNGEWKISYLGWLNAGMYEQGGEKLQTAKNLCYNNIIAGIAFAKSQGLSVEDYAKWQGELWKTVWDKEVGFNGLVDFAISSWTALSGQIEILNQSENNLVIKVSDIYPELKTSEGLLNVTYDELMTWTEEMMIPISEYLGCSFSLLIKDDGVEIIINKI
ncbi:MAG: nuclear transport factor 2 family protein [Bacteroidota bacterium]